MGEIKSTLDIVLRKTEHLKQTDQEKAEQEADRTAQKLKGLLQKYVDRTLSEEQFYKELSDLAGGNVPAVLPELIREILDMLDIEKDNSALLHLLDSTGSDVPARSMCAKAVHKLNELRDSTIAALETMLHDEWCVYGAAVKPNVEQDSRWQQGREALRLQLRTELEREKSRIKKTAGTTV